MGLPQISSGAMQYPALTPPETRERIVWAVKSGTGSFTDQVATAEAAAFNCRATPSTIWDGNLRHFLFTLSAMTAGDIVRMVFADATYAAQVGVRVKNNSGTYEFQIGNFATADFTAYAAFSDYTPGDTIAIAVDSSVGAHGTVYLEVNGVPEDDFALTAGVAVTPDRLRYYGDTVTDPIDATMALSNTYPIANSLWYGFNPLGTVDTAAIGARAGKTFFTSGMAYPLTLSGWVIDNGMLIAFDNSGAFFGVIEPVKKLPDSTLATIAADYDPTTYDGYSIKATDLGREGIVLYASDGRWRLYGGTNIMTTLDPGDILFPGLMPSGVAATYSQSGTTITVTSTGHGLQSWMNGSRVHLTQGTGTFVTEWCTNFTRVDANTFTCTSAVSQTTSGDLGTNTAETYSPLEYVLPDLDFQFGDYVQPQIADQVRTTTGTKTRRTYLNSALIAANVTTNSTSPAAPGGGTTFMVGDGTVIGIGQDTTARTIGDRTYKFSMQTNDAKEWIYRRVFGISCAMR